MSKLKLIKNLSIAGGGLVAAGLINQIINLATPPADDSSSDNVAFDQLSITLFRLAAIIVIPAILISLKLATGEYMAPIEQGEAFEVMGDTMTSKGRTDMNNHASDHLDEWNH